jgi:hypothetical protein
MIAPDELDRVVAILQALVGRHVIIDESISRKRELGHDRHWATFSQLSFQLRSVTTTFSGLQLVIEGDVGRYGIALPSVAQVVFEPELAIVERFETSTERRTTFAVREDVKEL